MKLLVQNYQYKQTYIIQEVKQNMIIYAKIHVLENSGFQTFLTKPLLPVNFGGHYDVTSQCQTMTVNRKSTPR